MSSRCKLASRCCSEELGEDFDRDEGLRCVAERWTRDDLSCGDEELQFAPTELQRESQLVLILAAHVCFRLPPSSRLTNEVAPCALASNRDACSAGHPKKHHKTTQVL